jgi:hypothetical protein
VEVAKEEAPPQNASTPPTKAVIIHPLSLILICDDILQVLNA